LADWLIGWLDGEKNAIAIAIVDDIAAAVANEPTNQSTHDRIQRLGGARQMSGSHRQMVSKGNVLGCAAVERNETARFDARKQRYQNAVFYQASGGVTGFPMLLLLVVRAFVSAHTQIFVCPGIKVQ